MTKHPNSKKNSTNQELKPLDKSRKKVLDLWLKSLKIHTKGPMLLSSILGVFMGIALIVQAAFLADLLHKIIIERIHPDQLIGSILILLAVFFLRAILLLTRERVVIRAGHSVRLAVRKSLIEYFTRMGPAGLQHKNAGSWSSLLVEQIDNLHDYYSRYLPQMRLAATTPILILVAVFYCNWAAGLILLLTAPLIPLFMALVGMGAADANRRNFAALSRLSGYFLDRLKGLETLRLFYRKDAEIQSITVSSEEFRKRTMEVLRLAFLSSGVLEFFTSISIALMAVYFGFSFLGDLNFGNYSTPITLFTGFFCLMLAPEFYQPLRDLGAFYHAKAQAIAAADNLEPYLSDTSLIIPSNQSNLAESAEHSSIKWQSITAENVYVLSHDGICLLGPVNFTIQAGDKIALIGESGSGKSSLINVLLGFLPYSGSLKVDGIELKELNKNAWTNQLHWLGQLPYLPARTIIENILLGSEYQNIIDPTTTFETLPVAIKSALIKAKVDEFIGDLPNGVHTVIGEDANKLSVGQAQRVALARLFVPRFINQSHIDTIQTDLIDQRNFWLLDEPTASLDQKNAEIVMSAITDYMQRNQINSTDSLADIPPTTISLTTMIMITHKLDDAKSMNRIWQLTKIGSIDNPNHTFPTEQSSSKRLVNETVVHETVVHETIVNETIANETVTEFGTSRSAIYKLVELKHV